jgi:hypothetical protein
MHLHFHSNVELIDITFRAPDDTEEALEVISRTVLNENS